MKDNKIFTVILAIIVFLLIVLFATIFFNKPKSQPASKKNNIDYTIFEGKWCCYEHDTIIIIEVNNDYMFFRVLKEHEIQAKSLDFMIDRIILIEKSNQNHNIY